MDVYQNNGQPLVSVIIPVYNCEKYIKKCLNSVMQQSYLNIEIIVIDDGSTDASLEIIKRLLDTDERIVLIQQSNQGVSVARNIGVDKACGKYVTFLDGDDYIGCDYIKIFVANAEEADAELCVCGYTMVDEHGKKILELSPKEKYIKCEQEEYIYKILGISGRFYNKEFWIKHNIRFEENKKIRGEDIPIAMMTNVLAANIKNIEQSSYYYVQHNTSARHNMQGLKKYDLPYSALEKCIRYIQNQRETNGKDFFEVCLLRVFFTFLLDLGKNTELDKYDEIYQYERRILKMYFPNCLSMGNLIKIFCMNLSWKEKVLVIGFALLIKFNLAYIVGRCWRKITL